MIQGQNDLNCIFFIENIEIKQGFHNNCTNSILNSSETAQIVDIS